MHESTASVMPTQDASPLVAGLDRLSERERLAQELFGSAVALREAPACAWSQLRPEARARYRDAAAVSLALLSPALRTHVAEQLAVSLRVRHGAFVGNIAAARVIAGDLLATALEGLAGKPMVRRG